MDQVVTKHGPLYVALIIPPSDESGRQLIARVCDSIARPHGLQSMAVVLLDAHAFQLSRDNFDRGGAECLALAVVNGHRRRR